MSLAEITQHSHVLDAIAEFDRLGRERFLEKYGFGSSRSYWLIHNGKRYDSKAIIGAARGYARPDLGPMPASEFSGGEATVRPKLEDLRFRVEITADDAGPDSATVGERTSWQLDVDAVYTRDDLRKLFGIVDATINSGVFRPKGTSSIWLFITREKTADRTQYRDRLEGDLLHWQGQTSGRTDAQIIDHVQRGMEVLVFFRERKYEHPGAGFRYLGPFQYVNHSGNHPTSFVLRRQSSGAAGSITSSVADETPFDPSNVTDARERIKRSIAQRRGQRAFRDALLRAYDGACAISGCTVPDVLEAAHIFPYRGPDTNHPSNGLLLRADLHTLFDCGLIWVDANSLTVRVAPTLRSGEYGALHGRPLRAPSTSSASPSREALVLHRQECGL